MEKIEVSDVSTILNENQFATVSGYLDGFQLDHETKEFLYESTITVVEGFGLPDDFTIYPPPKAEADAIVCFIDGEWVQNKELFTLRKTAELEEKRKEMTEQIEQRLIRLERKKSINRITKEENDLRIKLTGILFDLEELDLTDPECVFPEMP